MTRVGLTTIILLTLGLFFLTAIPVFAENIEILSLLPDQLREAGIFFENNEEKSGTIYIPEECANYGIWNEAASTCTLVQDLTDNVEITENNISLDCDGHSIVGSEDGYGILLDNKEGITIENCIVTNFAGGIYLFSSSYNTISNNIVSENNEVGIALDSSNNNDLINNIANSNTYAGLFISSSDENVFRNNAMNNNQWNFFFSPFLYLEGYPDYFEFDFDNDIDTSNTVNGKPIYFIKNATNQIYDSSTNAGVFYCIFCKNVIIKDLNLSNNSSGVVLWETDDSRVENCNASNNYFGIELYFSENNILINNNILENEFIGALLFDSSNNKVFHNNFINNNFQAMNIYIGINNLFDNGYPDGGNYWSDYIGIDEKSGENQDQLGSDGIGDTPYSFPGGHDRYPFMNESGWQAPEQWSFAIITDIHIGDGFLDYGSPGWDDSSGQESTYSIRNLKNIIARINSNKEKYNIAFAVVDGDFTDSAELSELNKAREILNDLEIPWIPLIGNHDVWPFYGKNPDPINREAEMAPEVDTEQNGTDKYFNNIFNPQYEKLKNIFQNWEKASVPVWNPETDPSHFSFFQNFAFNFNNYHFIGLDFAHRVIESYPLKGAAAEGNLHNFASGS